MPYCRVCGESSEDGKTCSKCKEKKRKEYQKSYYEKQKMARTNIDKWEFRLGLKKSQIKKLTKEIEAISQRIKEVKEYENKKS